MKKVLLLVMTVMVAFSCSQKVTNELSGAGATFPQPFYNIVFKDFSDKTGNKVTYGGIGSGGGIRSLQDKTVDFGASDAFLTDEEMADMGGEVLHIPTCMGAVVLAYNLPEIPTLNLNAEIVSDIYLGKITKWNDAKIQALNPDVKLPEQTVTPVYRSDGSGTTFVFSDYMAKASTEWAEKMGTGKSLAWPAGIASKGNPGVAGTIQQTKGAIGYVGSEFSLSQKIPTALMQNSAGNFIEAGTESISAAAKGELPIDMRTMVTNSPEPDAYPISCFTWIILYKEQAYAKRDLNKAITLVELMDYILSDDAQSVAANIHYSPLPETALQNAKAILSTVTFENKEVK
ncbi:MAG: phosphate ABC transporter substrate-binding protein PstS [Dysgonamonadaceae bacterium]|jgi:phosphate transport system substrate-binding protein|nr:phosphate ABC transporter substrate-binding protein PstS [Dysgonamonadaceae bacterium]